MGKIQLGINMSDKEIHASDTSTSGRRKVIQAASSITPINEYDSSSV
jgi:hypothetical protein